MPPKKKPSTPKLPTPVNAHNHADKRANIPTEELRDFIADEEKSPKTVLYPRDPSLDPQLVWKGKDEQDSKDLAVPAVPIYIQEHIKPQAIIDLVRGTNLSLSYQPSLFNDFNGLTFEDRVDFYHHEQHWSNRMILGDSLMVMTSLAEKEGLKGKVQMIYFDPPYGIKFGSNWQVSTRKRDVKDGKAEDTTRQPEQVKAFRDTWQLGIHSYLAYLRDRLVSARELLSESGSVFVQIGDENVHLVRSILDEVFGSDNFLSCIVFRKTGSFSADFIANTSDNILWYAKNRETAKYRQLYSERVDLSGLPATFSIVDLPDGSVKRLTDEERLSGDIPEGAKPYQSVSLESEGWRSGNLSQPFTFQNTTYKHRNGAHWKTGHEGLRRLGYQGRLLFSGESIRYKMYLDDFPVMPINNIWADVMGASDLIYVVQTNSRVIQRCMLMTTDPGDLVLDPTCGSGTTAYVAEQWGRRWITIDTSRVSIALARTRLMSGRYPYYLLADSAEGRRKEAEVSTADFSRLWSEESTIPTEVGGTVGGTVNDIKRGFVYERVPHVTLKSIANNEEIDEIHAKVQSQLDELRAQINKAMKKNWQEWEIPRDLSGFTSAKVERDTRADKGTAPSDSLGNLTGLLQKYWSLRQERQRAIDASIARRADTEFLYDKPYQDNKRVRVSGPFTVESLSPHRVLAPDDPATAFKEDLLNTRDFTTMILENLKSAGVQNTVKNQRLKFDSLEPYAGTWIHAVGKYTEKLPSPSGEGSGVRSRRAALSIGPELGTVSAEQVKRPPKKPSSASASTCSSSAASPSTRTSAKKPSVTENSPSCPPE